ncbi:sulfotransferase family protein [Actibacterium atlanticum]|nr:sulfotransferase [Actibacterium atlanticum]
MSLPQPIFVVALPKSYTSVFSGMLGQHPNLMTTPELNIFVGDTIQQWADQPSANIFCDGLIRTVAQLFFGAQTPQTVQQALDWLQSRASWSVQQLMDALREAAAPAALIDQSPIYMQKPAFLQRILTNYPDARFIHLTRNPVSWVRSMEKWGIYGEEIMRMFAASEVGLTHQPAPLDLWHAAYTGIDRLMEGLRPEQHIKIYGEDVVTRPKEAMKQVLDWLDLPAEEAHLEAMMHPEESIFAGWGPMGARGGNNPDFLTAPQLRTRDDRDDLMTLNPAGVPQEVVELAVQLGYQAA